MTEDAQVQGLLTLLRYGLHTEQMPEQICLPKQMDERRVFELARAHAVLPLIREAWSRCISPELKAQLDQRTIGMINTSYRLLFYTRYVVGLLEQEGLQVAVLKGAATAQFYPQPELRKSGDVDILLFDEECCSAGVACLKKHGFRIPDETHHQHHVALVGPEGIEVELHSILAEPFDSQAVNRRILDYQKLAREHVIRQSCMGVELPVLCGAYHGLSLLLHLLGHFLTAGFGIKLLCDWVVFWREQPTEVIGEMEEMICTLKVQQFAAAVTLVCMRYLGMSGEAADVFSALGSEQVQSPDYVETFFSDIVAAEEFGKSQKGRMVALQGHGLWGYVRTFHHQMHLNFPRAGRVPLAWPWLWIVTLHRFSRNNRTIRKTSLAAVLKSAGSRGRIAEELHLFQ